MALVVAIERRGVSAATAAYQDNARVGGWREQGGDVKLCRDMLQESINADYWMMALTAHPQKHV